TGNVQTVRGRYDRGLKKLEQKRGTGTEIEETTVTRTPIISRPPGDGDNALTRRSSIVLPAPSKDDLDVDCSSLITQTPATPQIDENISNHVGAIDLPATLEDKPSIAVLPFQNQSGDPNQEYLVDGIVNEIINSLSCYRWLSVIALNSKSTNKDRLEFK